MGCVGRGIPETGLWEKEKFCLPFGGGGCVCDVGMFAEGVFIICPGGRDDGKIGEIKAKSRGLSL